MNKNKPRGSIILGLILITALLFPGCKPGDGEKTEIVSAQSTPTGTNNYQENGIIPRRAKFFRKWEE